MTGLFAEVRRPGLHIVLIFEPTDTGSRCWPKVVLTIPRCKRQRVALHKLLALMALEAMVLALAAADRHLPRWIGSITCVSR